MTLRIVATPLAPSVEFPLARDGRFDFDLAAAVVESPAREAALSRLAQPGALAVTSGQQPGLLTGPLYTIYKALSSAALARTLERQWHRPVVPVFWVAGDDHDFAEASRASWITADGTLRTVTLPSRAADAPLTPMYREPLGPMMDEVFATLEADLQPFEFREWTLEWLRRHYHSTATVAHSFAGALSELLAPAGVICLDSTHPAVKRAAAPYLMRALQRAPELDRALMRRAEELKTLGRDAGVALGDEATLVMLEGEAGRDRLVASNRRFQTRRSGEAMDLPALDRIARGAPERLSPNVLLRPVIESALLPTVAYVAGPGELRYLALTPPVYELLGVPRQQVVPRWSGVLVEPRVERVLQKFQLEVEDLLNQPGGALEARVVRSQLPEEAVRALEALRSAIQAGYEELAQSAATIDPTLVRTVEGTRNQALAGLQDMEKKLVQHLKRRQATELAQIARARTVILPEDKPQERVLGIVSFLARYGPSLVTELSQTIEAWYDTALEGVLNPS
jgi:bacillithiol biosynthesis cysteine-adding enzyme BshC